MSSEEGDHLTDKEKRYQRRRHQKFDYTNDKEDKGKTPLSRGEDEEKEFPKILLRAMKKISREIKEMRMDRYKEFPKGFHHSEGSDMSHHWSDQPVQQPQVSQRSKCLDSWLWEMKGFKSKNPLKTILRSMSLKLKDSRTT